MHHHPSSCARLGQVLPDDMEDPDHEPAVPLHQAEQRRQGVECTEVFSSKIIHQRTERRDRFRHNPRFMRILAHSHPECTLETIATSQPWPRPESSPFPCDQCHRRFPTAPVFLPMTMLDGVPEEWGNFCSGPCAMTYLHTNMRDAFLAARSADLLETLRVVHGFRGTTVGFAPHFTQRQEYGGDLTDEQFQAIVDRPNLTTVILRKPFCPTLEVVEWQCVAAARDTGEAASETLERVMGTAAPALDHHQQWNVNNLQQPSVDTTVRRLASLPRPEPVQDPALIPFNAFVEAKRAAEAAAAAAPAAPAPIAAPASTAAAAAAAAPAAADDAASASASASTANTPRPPRVRAAPKAPRPETNSGGGLGDLVAQAPPRKRVRKSTAAAVADAAP
jgi:hypothetical protein